MAGTQNTNYLFGFVMKADQLVENEVIYKLCLKASRRGDINVKKVTLL